MGTFSAKHCCTVLPIVTTRSYSCSSSGVIWTLLWENRRCRHVHEPPESASPSSLPWYVIRYDRHSLQTRILACPLHFEVVVKYTIFKQKDLIAAHPELKKTFPCLQRVGADATQPLEVQGRGFQRFEGRQGRIDDPSGPQAIIDEQSIEGREVVPQSSPTSLSRSMALLFRSIQPTSKASNSSRSGWPSSKHPT